MLFIYFSLYWILKLIIVYPNYKTRTDSIDTGPVPVQVLEKK